MAKAAFFASQTFSVSWRTVSGSKFTFVMVVNNPSNNSSACGGWMGWPSSTSSSANPMSAPVSASCASAVSADLPHTPALPTQAQPLAACSHWKQNIFSSIGKTSLFVIKRVWTKLHPAMHVSAGSFSEDRPLGWDPVAAGNRAGDGMACNNNDRRQWRNQGIVVGAAASKTQAQAKRMMGAATRPRVRRESSPNGRNRTNKKSRTRRGAALKNARRISR